LRRFGLGTVFGAALAWLLDPRGGARRRNVMRDRTLAFFRRGGRRTERAVGAVRAEAYGVTRKLTHLHEQPKEFDDVTLARKVETKIFRDAGVPKGQINVNAEDGVVYLRGEVPTPEMIDDLFEKTRHVQGVHGVKNLLHLPNTPAPTLE
jgi:osmotically-inducible protein OsmY